MCTALGWVLRADRWGGHGPTCKVSLDISEWEPTPLIFSSQRDKRVTLIVQLVKNPPAMQELIPGLGRATGVGIGYSFQYSWASFVAQLIKNLPAMREDLGLTPGLGRSPGEGKGYSLHYSGMENSMDCIVHKVARVRHDWETFTYLNLKK